MKWLMLSVAFGCLGVSGCAVCASPYDETYSAYGGRWERDVDNHGRVGSAFTESGYLVSDEDVLEEENHDPSIDAEDPEASIRTISHSTATDSDAYPVEDDGVLASPSYSATQAQADDVFESDPVEAPDQGGSENRDGADEAEPRKEKLPDRVL